MAVPTFFRADGWVKSVQGYAVPGAQVYVCTQPANQIIPPTPLQPIFSDPNGISPVTQPLITDGFGHYDFYVTPGTYTVIVALGGQIQQVYQDQTIGLSSNGGGGGGISVEVNSTPLSSLTLLNLVNSASVTFTDNGLGAVSATAAGVTALSQLTDVSIGEKSDRQSLVWIAADGKWENAVPTSFEVNGINFSTGSAVTNVLNFVDTSTIAWVDGGSGQAEASIKNVFSTSGLGYIVSDYGLSLQKTVNSVTTLNAAGGNAANAVDVIQICIPFPITLRNFTVSIGTNASGTVGMGVYNSSGSALGIGSVSGAVQGTFTVAISTSPLTLSPGVYYTAIAISSTSIGVNSSYLVSLAAGGSGTSWGYLLNKNSSRTGVAVNAMSGGVMPSSLGGVNAWTATASSVNIPGFLLET